RSRPPALTPSRSSASPRLSCSASVTRRPCSVTTTGSSTGPEAEAPVGLAQLLVALEPEQRIEWLEAEGTSVGGIEPDPRFPLPANDEQRQIMERLQHDNGVVVQGPPGTGKSHSIANLVAALLAQGHRVLVTSQKAQALRVLREKLPDEIAELCVT